jgi:nitrogen-specific signal transduction histidine kinase
VLNVVAEQAVVRLCNASACRLADDLSGSFIREVRRLWFTPLISTRNEPDGVSVEVRDSGPGFAPAALERVFEAFYTTKSGGLGLGLSICRSIIEAHNGRCGPAKRAPRCHI